MALGFGLAGRASGPEHVRLLDPALLAPWKISVNAAYAFQKYQGAVADGQSSQPAPSPGACDQAAVLPAGASLSITVDHADDVLVAHGKRGPSHQYALVYHRPIEASSRPRSPKIDGPMFQRSRFCHFVFVPPDRFQPTKVLAVRPGSSGQQRRQGLRYKIGCICPSKSPGQKRLTRLWQNCREESRIDDDRNGLYARPWPVDLGHRTRRFTVKLEGLEPREPACAYVRTMVRRRCR